MVFPGPLTDLCAWVDFYTSIPQQGVKYQLWYLKCFWWRGDLYKYPMTNILKDGRVLVHLGFRLKILPMPLTDLNAWVVFCTSSPQQCVKYQLWYLKNKLRRGISINIPWKLYYGRQSSCPLRVYVRDIAQAFNWLKCLGGFLQFKPTAWCQISDLIFEKKQVWRVISINIPWKLY